MNYVKEYAGFQVPDGAKYFAGDSRIQRVGFYKWNADELMFYSVSNYGKWEKSINSEVPSWAIELPEAPQEWMPDVGEECEVLHYDKWIKCFYIGFDINHDHVYQFASDFGIHKSYLNVFRPLKTQQEKGREAFAKCLVKVLNSVPNGTSLSDLHTMAEKAYDAGFTAPKASDNE